MFTIIGSSTEKVAKGSRAQEYRKAHDKFLELWAKGLDPLEIGLVMGLSKNQLAKHSLEAYEGHADRPTPTHSCILWDDLPAQIKKFLPGEKGDLLRVEGDDSGVTITKSPAIGPEHI